MNNLITKRLLNTDVGKIAERIIFTNDAIPKSGFATGEQDIPIFNSKRIGDTWVDNAILKRGENKNMKMTNTLSIPLTLKVLQNLRRDQNDFLYFTFLNKLKLLDINWISQNHSLVKVNYDLNMPLEFYNELSCMLLKKSLSFTLKNHRQEIQALGKFAFEILREYLQDSKRQLNMKFLNNCFQVIVRTRSVIYMEEAFKLLHNSMIKDENINESNFKLLTQFIRLSFLSETNQILQMKYYLARHQNEEINEILIEDRTMFSKLILKIVRRLISNNYQSEIIDYLNKIYLDWKLQINPVDSVILKNICRKYKLNSILLMVNNCEKCNNNDINDNDLLPGKQNKISIIDNIFTFRANDFNINEPQTYLSIAREISKLGLKPEQLLVLLKENIQRYETNEKLEILILNSAFTYLGQQTRYGCAIKLLEYLVYDFQNGSELLAKSSADNNIQYPGLHSIFRIFSKSERTTLTFFYFFKALFNTKIPQLQIRLDDFKFVLGHSNIGTQSLEENPRLFYYYLFKYLQLFGSDFMLNKEWTFSSYFKDNFNHIFVPEIDNILANMKETFERADGNPTSDEIWNVYHERFACEEANLEKYLTEQLQHVYSNYTETYKFAMDSRNAIRISTLLGTLESQLLDVNKEYN